MRWLNGVCSSWLTERNRAAIFPKSNTRAHWGVGRAKLTLSKTRTIIHILDCFSAVNHLSLYILVGLADELATVGFCEF